MFRKQTVGGVGMLAPRFHTAGNDPVPIQVDRSEQSSVVENPSASVGEGRNFGDDGLLRSNATVKSVVRLFIRPHRLRKCTCAGAPVAANTCAKAEVGLGLLAGVGVLPSACEQCDRNETEIMVPLQMQAERYAVIGAGNIVALVEYELARLSVKFLSLTGSQ